MKFVMRWIVTWFIRIVGVWAFLMLSLGPKPAAGYGTQTLDSPWTLCAKHTQKQEHAERIPHRLLRAISLAESGRWHPDTGEISAWPWTVMAQGKGRFFDTKQAALDWVRNLQGQGVTNIDVGCMQVNLFHHGHQFPSLEHAFDPEYNTQYAAKFLKEKYTAARSWTMAAGHYHSTDPVKNTPYRRKVFQFWHGQASKPDPQRAATASINTVRLNRTKNLRRAKFIKPPQRVAIDYSRTQKLNARFRRFNQQSLARTPLNSPDLKDPAETLKNPTETLRQPAAFRTNRSIKKITRSNGTGQTDGFALRRRAQLKKWRRTRSWQPRGNNG